MNAAYFNSKLLQRPICTTSINTNSFPIYAKSNLIIAGTVTRTYKVPTATGSLKGADRLSDPPVTLIKGKKW